MEGYAGQQFVGIDLHRRRSVIVRTTAAGEVLESARIVNDVERLGSGMARAGAAPQVVIEATYGWHWAVDALAAGAVHFRARTWVPAVKTTSLDFHLRWHDLRHTNASWLLAGGADLKTVMDRLGHTQLTTTQQYLHTLPTPTTPPWPHSPESRPRSQFPPRSHDRRTDHPRPGRAGRGRRPEPARRPRRLA